jgi:hypothetical protein
VHDVEGVGEALLFRVHDDVDIALVPAGDRLRFVNASLAKAEALKQRLELDCGSLVHRELDELDAPADRARRKHGHPG